MTLSRVQLEEVSGLGKGLSLPCIDGETEAQGVADSAAGSGRLQPRRELSGPPTLPAQAQYRRGLELSKQAAQLGAAGGAGEAGGAELPELAAFAATQRAFQAKLTHFYMAAERQRTDLETQLHLHHFCKRVSLAARLHRHPRNPHEARWGAGSRERPRHSTRLFA